MNEGHNMKKENNGFFHIWLVLFFAVFCCMLLYGAVHIRKVYARPVEAVTVSDFEIISEKEIIASSSSVASKVEIVRDEQAEVQTEEPAATIYTDSEIIIIPEPKERPGYDFIGWNTKEAGTGDWYYPGDEYEMHGWTNFYAIWEDASPAVTPSEAECISLFSESRKVSPSEASPSDFGK